jgi:hypothetical protein
MHHCVGHQFGGQEQYVVRGLGDAPVGQRVADKRSSEPGRRVERREAGGRARAQLDLGSPLIGALPFGTTS